MPSVSQLKASEKYKKSHIKRIAFEVQQQYFETVIKPEAEKRGETINGFIKKAIEERIGHETSET